MQYKIGLILGITVSLIFIIGAGLTFSQEPAVTGQITSETQIEPDVQWLWGEVVSIDIQKSELLVKYLDYETGEEKQITMVINEKTAYEDVKALSEIKPRDTVSIDYTVNPEGKNIAQNISVERPESEETLPQGSTP